MTAAALEIDYAARGKRTARAAVGAALLFILVAVGGGLLVRVGSAVIAFGQVTPESRVKRIAHPTGGVVSEIHVADGDTVERGQIVMRLDNDVSGIDADLSSRTLDQLVAQRARLEAEISSGAIAFPPELANRKDSAALEIMESERRRLALDRAQRGGKQGELAERDRQLARQIDGYEARLASLRRQRELIGPELEGVRKLREQGYVTVHRLNEIERTAVDLDGSIGSLEANIAQTRAAMGEVDQQRFQVTGQARSAAGAELERVDAAINSQRVTSASAGDRFDRSIIRAPYAGTVEKLAFHAVGDVVKPAETILEIVPRDDRPVIEGSVSPADIDRVRVGQVARIRLSAFNRATTPEISGKVIFVASDPRADERTGRRFYPVRVILDPASQKIADRLGLVTGMPAELLIESGNRSILSYLFKPLRDQFARAFLD